MSSSTVENYIKQLYLEQQKQPGALVSMGKLAAAMGVAPGTATSMIKTLHESGLVNYEPRYGVALSKGGEKLALHVLRRHRLVELFLVQMLGLNWAEVHEEAEALEHVISDRVLDRLDELLDHPRVDPHGDPIPSARGKLSQPRLIRLADCKPGQAARIARVVDQNAGFLQFADRSGLVPGVRIAIEKVDLAAQAITVVPHDRTAVNMGLQAAANILVESAAS